MCIKSTFQARFVEILLEQQVWRKQLPTKEKIFVLEKYQRQMTWFTR